MDEPNKKRVKKSETAGSTHSSTQQAASWYFYIIVRPLLIGHENVDTKTPKKRNGCPLFRFRSGHFRVHNFFDLSPYRTRKIKVEFCQSRPFHFFFTFPASSGGAAVRLRKNVCWKKWPRKRWEAFSCPEFSCPLDTKICLNFRVERTRKLRTRKFLDGFSCSGSYKASDTKTLGHETRFRVHFFCALGPIRSSLKAMYSYLLVYMKIWKECLHIIRSSDYSKSSDLLGKVSMEK